MKPEFLEYLRCPACGGRLLLVEAFERGEEVLAGQLRCSSCESAHEIVEGIPVLLPPQIPNPAEQDVRRRVSREVAEAVEHWRHRYDRHHFRARVDLKLERLVSAASASPRILDVGIGWGVVYQAIVERAEVWGIDFSLESLILARRIYASEGLPPPQLICGSLNAVPLGGIRFDLIRSTQVYQHIANRDAVRQSLRLLVEKLLDEEGELVVENLNFGYARWAGRIRGLVRGRLAPSLRERINGDYYLRYYLPEDFEMAMGDLACTRIAYSEVVFHPEFRLMPRSRGAARLDVALSRLPGAGLLARQIELHARPRAG